MRGLNYIRCMLVLNFILCIVNVIDANHTSNIPAFGGWFVAALYIVYAGTLLPHALASADEDSADEDSADEDPN